MFLFNWCKFYYNNLPPAPQSSVTSILPVISASTVIEDNNRDQVLWLQNLNIKWLSDIYIGTYWGNLNTWNVIITPYVLLLFEMSVVKHPMSIGLHDCCCALINASNNIELQNSGMPLRDGVIVDTQQAMKIEIWWKFYGFHNESTKHWLQFHVHRPLGYLVIFQVQQRSNKLIQ